MSLVNDASRSRHTFRGLDTAAVHNIKLFLRGAAWCWCATRPTEWFALRDLMGGDNTDWTGTPLIALYRQHMLRHPTDEARAIAQAGRDAGWLLKAALQEDSRAFETDPQYDARYYRWHRPALTLAAA